MQQLANDESDEILRQGRLAVEASTLRDDRAVASRLVDFGAHQKAPDLPHEILATVAGLASRPLLVSADGIGPITGKTGD